MSESEGSEQDFSMDDIGGDSTTDEDLPTPVKKVKKLKCPRTAKEFDDSIAKWKPILECVVCQEPCSSFSLLLDHFSEKHPTERCYISCCQQKFYYRYEIERHVHYHNEPNAYKCEVCMKAFSAKRELRQHLLYDHTEISKKSFECPSCKSTLKTEPALRKHMKYNCNKRSVAETDRPHDCQECGKSYKSLRTLRVHYKRMHLRNHKISKCTVCDKEFNNKTDLRHHMDSHASERSHACQFCSRTYAHRTSLFTHIRVSHPKENDELRKEKDKLRKEKAKCSSVEKTYKCTSCESAYRTPLALLEHQATHQGKALYQCNLCPKEYKYSSNLAVHRKKEHPEEHQKNVERRKKKNVWKVK